MLYLQRVLHLVEMLNLQIKKKLLLILIVIRKIKKNFGTQKKKLKSTPIALQ